MSHSTISTSNHNGSSSGSTNPRNKKATKTEGSALTDVLVHAKTALDVAEKLSSLVHVVPFLSSIFASTKICVDVVIVSQLRFSLSVFTCKLK